MSKMLFIFIGLTLNLNLASASIDGLSDAYLKNLRKTQTRIGNQKLNMQPTPKTCPAQLYNITKDNQLDIFMAFGYMDASNAAEFVDSDASNFLYELGDVLDMDSRDAFVRVLTSSCKQKSDRFFACGFGGDGNFYSKKIHNKFTGQKMTVNVTVMSPSVSSNDAVNRQSPVQAQSSAYVRAHFYSALKTHDAVIYMGHARSGKGPDFGPKGVASSSLAKVVSELASSATPAPVIGLLACKGTSLFQSQVANAAEKSLIVTAGELFDYSDVVPTGYAMLEALVSQQCRDGFINLVKVQPNSASYVNFLFQ